MSLFASAPAQPQSLKISLPDWVPHWLAGQPPCADDDSKMRLAIALARENVRHGSGGPFGAAVFNLDNDELIAVGVNRVVPLNNSVLHAEIMALMLAEARLHHYSLRAAGMPRYGLFSSSAPCAMCLGATLWSGVRRLAYAASHLDAMNLGFDEGPVYPSSFRYLEARGIDIVPELLREEACEVFSYYRQQHGTIYNP